MATPGEYCVAVNEQLKATELVLNRLGKDKKHGAHVRAFWASTISFFLAFMAWFALAPISLEVAHSIDICENQEYLPVETPKRLAYLKYKALATDTDYCQYGKVGGKKKPTDCVDVPAEITTSPDCEGFTQTCTKKECPVKCQKYLYHILPKCVCPAGTACREVILYASLGSVAITVLVRVALGTLLERFGPVNVQTCLMSFGSIVVFCAAGIFSSWSFILVWTLIGCMGATFVTNQFWCSLMYAPSIVGTVNATAAGWGNLGGGVTQIVIVWVLFKPLQAAGLDDNAAWRTAMLFPGVACVICASSMKFCCWDTPTKPRFTTADVGKATGASMSDYVECLKDYKVVAMIIQYSACFGTELAMNAQLATHFRSYFQMDPGGAAILAGSFGMMNLFARSLGGMLSDALFIKFRFPGRIWAQFICLFFEGIFLFIFGCVDNTQPWYVALIVLIFFSLSVQMAEGTSYGIVPFMKPKQLSCVSALVGAGGNMGAVLALWAFYRPLGAIDVLLPFKVHAGYVFFAACLSPLYYWPDKGGMFWGPVEEVEPEKKAPTST
jgi:NNP family nitrate/nitrite transporter-like MFS transporter